METTLKDDSLSQQAMELAQMLAAGGSPKPVEKLELAPFVNVLKTAIGITGLKYSDSMLRRFVSALLAKPFVVLTGLSGSGKTKLAETFVRWICEKDPKRWRIVPIGADWTDSQKLLGFPNALDDKRYILPDTQVLQMLIDADKDPDNPYFLILDEMNLSVVERYFADFLNDGIKQCSIQPLRRRQAFRR